MESVEDVPLLGVLRPWHCSEDCVLRPVRQQHRERGGGAKLPLSGQTSHHGALPGAGLHLQMGGEAVEPGTARTDSGFWNQSVFSLNKFPRTNSNSISNRTFIYFFVLLTLF